MARKKAEKAAAPPSFRNLMTFHLHRIARISERISEQYYRKHLGQSLPECRVIGITAGYGPVSFKRVAAAANLEKSYASRVVSQLVERGVIEKLANPSDSRSVLLQLTEEGRAVHERTYALAVRLNQFLQHSFRDTQVADFIGFLGTLEQQLEQASRLIESGGDLPASPGFAARNGESRGGGGDGSFVLDRAFARQLHEMLGKYLAEED